MENSFLVDTIVVSVAIVGLVLALRSAFYQQEKKDNE